MQMSKRYIYDQLDAAQKLLWGGSETENIQAHNIVAKLLSDLGLDSELEDVIESQQGKE
jgi:hypothetical protein